TWRPTGPAPRAGCSATCSGPLNARARARSARRRPIPARAGSGPAPRRTTYRSRCRRCARTERRRSSAGLFACGTRTCQKRTPNDRRPAAKSHGANDSRHQTRLARHSLRQARMDTLRQDLVYALRRLRQAPVFAFVAIATLALGIGANGAIFSVVNAVLLRPLPFSEPNGLVMVNQIWEGKATVYSPQNFLDMEASAKSFESLAALDSGGITLTGRGTAVRLEGAEVGASFFGVLRVAPILGRGFLPGENDTGRNKVAVLGHRLWSERFGADPAIVGQNVQLNRESYLVVGVAPAGFAYPENVEIWTPMEYDTQFRTKSRGAWYLTVIGRLKPGVSVAHAREEVGTIAARLATQYKEVDEGVGATVRSLH